MPGEAARLAAELVRIPSPSGEEQAAARHLTNWALDRGLPAECDETGVRVTLAGEQTGPLLVFASHLDTVPAGEGWTIDPHSGLLRDGCLWGRGAVDAKGPLSAMAAAIARIESGGGLRAGTLVLLATFCEETREASMPAALERLGRMPDAALIGEPTSLAPCVAQRGLMIVELRWRGEQLHAGWAAQLDPPPANAILTAAADLARVEEMSWPEEHPLLGRTAVTPVTISAGVARNVTPPSCSAVLDIRSTPALSHEAIAERLSLALEGEVEVVSDRLRPAATPPGSRLLRALSSVSPEAEPFASPTASDWVWLREADAVKLGPGDSRRSHTADERVSVLELERATKLYADTARAYFQP